MYSPAEFLTKVFNFVNKHFTCLSGALNSTQSSYQGSRQDNDINKISLTLFYKITLFHTAMRWEECEYMIIFCILRALQMALSLCTREGRFILECICGVLLMCGGPARKIKVLKSLKYGNIQGR